MTMVKLMQNLKQGVALISVLAITAISLIVLSTMILVSAVNGKMVTNQQHNQKAYVVAQTLIDETMLRFIRFRTVTNPYPDWTSNCLQISDIQCKMDISLGPSGGVINSWGKSGDIIRHLQVEVSVSTNDSVSITARREIY
jgi:hypothetical protein